MTTTTAVRNAGREHHEAVVAVLAPALANTAIAQWLIPDDDLRELNTVQHVDQLVGDAIADTRVTVHVITDTRTGVLAAAIWYDRPTGHATTGTRAYKDLNRIPGMLGDDPSVRARITILKDRLRGISMTARHHRLAYLAVDPAHRRQGLAQALLTHHHMFLDERGIPAHAIAQNNTDLAVLAITGYRAHRPTTVAGDLLVWPALRHPRSQ